MKITKKDKDKLKHFMTTSYTGPSFTYPDYDYNDYCDCDERCPKCGKRKKPVKPWSITCGYMENTI